MHRRLRLAALLLIVLVWNAALFAAPSGTPRGIAAAAYLAGSLICHQQPDRSFHQAGTQYPVCARCLGLYVGAVGGVLAWVAIAGAGRSHLTRSRRFSTPRFARLLLIAAAIPTLISVALGWTGIVDDGNVVRAVLALPLGATITGVIAAVAAGDLR